MTRRHRSWLPHLFAAVACILILPSLTTGFYLMLISATGDMGGPLNLVVIPCANWGITVLLALLLWPVTMLLETLLRRTGSGWQRRLLSPWPAGVLLSICALGVLAGHTFQIYSLASDPAGQANERFDWYAFLMLGGTPLALCGALYWFVLRLCDRLPARWQG